jgi:hypothetical protein
VSKLTGVVGPDIAKLPIGRLAEGVWKGAPENVRGVYAKT